MNKKLVVLLSLALMLVALCAFASAETKMEYYSADLQGVINPTRVVDKAIDSESKALVNVSVARGATLTIWYWNDATGHYNMKTGNQINKIIMSLRTRSYGAQITSGSGWLRLTKDSSGGLDWRMTTNLGTKTRKGKIRVYDAYGTVCYIEIRQCCDMDIVKVTQLDGWKQDGKVRVQSTKASGTHGKVYYNVGSYVKYDDVDDLYAYMTPKKYTKGKIWFHPNRPVGSWQYYYLRPYRVMGGKIFQGPMTSAWRVQVTH